MESGRLSIIEVDWDDPRAAALRAAMDVEMLARYSGRPHGKPQRAALRIEPATVAVTLLAMAGEQEPPIGHAAVRRHGSDLEVKRVFVDPAHRGRGAAAGLMAATEEFARRAGAARLILQTGDRQPDAVHLYEKLGYQPIPVFSPYEHISYSLCFAKALR